MARADDTSVHVAESMQTQRPRLPHEQEFAASGAVAKRSDAKLRADSLKNQLRDLSCGQRAGKLEHGGRGLPP